MKSADQRKTFISAFDQPAKKIESIDLPSFYDTINK
jgi:hypothetical protein